MRRTRNVEYGAANPQAIIHVACGFAAFRIPLVLVLLLFTPGCAWMRLGQKAEYSAFGPKSPCRVPPHATAEELVDFLNQNVDKLDGWQARHVKLRYNKMPLDAMITVAKGRKLRIQVMSMVGSEMDLGSNEEVFWFWAKRAPEPAVMYASHEQLDLVRETLQIPFEPNWLLEAMGVEYLPPEGTTLEPVNEQASRLVSYHALPNGRKIRKAITVDTCHGRVLEHSVWDAANRRIAHATFSHHRLDPETGVVLPQRIHLNWEQADVSLVMDLGKVDINPTALPDSLWQMPTSREYPLLNLEDLAYQHAGKRPRPKTPSRDEHIWQARGDRAREEPADLDAEEPFADEPR